MATGGQYGFVINCDGNAARQVANINLQVQHLNNSVNRSGSTFAAIFGGNLLANIATRFILMGISGAKAIYNLGVETQQTRAAFDVMLGSADKGKAMFDSLKEFADVTPFDNKTTYDAGRLLLNYGVEAKNVIPYMKMLGDASGGVKEKFDRQVYAFAQISTAGKLQGQDLRQLIDSGFNPLKVLAGDSTEKYKQLQKTMHDGKFTFAMVIEAYKKATGAGGLFNGMMEVQSRTVGGLASTLEGNLQTTLYGLFQRATPMMTGFLNRSIEIATAMGKWATPNASDLLTDKKVEMNAIFEVLKNANIPMDERKNLIAELNSGYKDYLSNLVTESDTYEQLTINQNNSNNKLKEKIFTEAKKEALQPYIDEYKTAIKTEISEKKSFEKYKIENPNWDKKTVWNAKTKEMEYDAWTKRRFRIEEENKTEREKAENKLSEQYEFIHGNNKVKSNNEFSLNKPKNNILKGEYTGLDSYFEKTKQAALNSVSDINKFKSALNKTGGSVINQTPEQKESDRLLKENDALKKNAAKESVSGAKGGLGEAKTINITFSQPLMTVNAEKMDGEDINDYALKAVESITRVLNNITYGQGVM
jgi:tape measure domain-containing protein